MDRLYLINYMNSKGLKLLGFFLFYYPFKFLFMIKLIKYMKNKIRKISSISGVITNSSTEVFIIWGEEALKSMIGCGVFKKYKKHLLYLKTEEDVINFVTETRKGYDHHYYREIVNGIGRRELISLYDLMCRRFPDRKDEILEFFKPEFIKDYKGSIIYYNYKNNEKIMRLLRNHFKENEGDNYKWRTD